MQARVVAVQIGHLGGLYGFNHGLGDEFHLMWNACNMFGGIQYQGSTGAQQVTGVGCNDGSVSQLNGG